jgi:hypothetical protein
VATLPQPFHAETKFEKAARYMDGSVVTEKRDFQFKKEMPYGGIPRLPSA